MNEYRVFIAHDGRDRSLAESIDQSLKNNGFDSYLFENEPRPGIDVPNKISNEIVTRDCLIVLITPNSHESPWVNQEIGLAIGKGKLIIPVMQRGTDENHKAMLRDIEPLMFDPYDPERTISQLIITMTRIERDKVVGLHQSKAQGWKNLLIFGAIIAGIALMFKEE